MFQKWGWYAGEETHNCGTLGIEAWAVLWLVEVVQGGRVSGGGMAQRKGGVLPTRPLSETPSSASPLTSVEVTVHLYCTQAVQPVWNSLVQDGINASIHPYAETWQSTPLCTYSTYLCSSLGRLSLKLLPLSFLSTESYDDPTQQLVQVQPLKEKDFCGTKREHVLLFARNLHCSCIFFRSIVLYHKLVLSNCWMFICWNFWASDRLLVYKVMHM